MSLDVNNISIVHWFPHPERHRCGYCKSEDGSISYGMWADTMTVRDYQNLIDRGWRRSGRYCYKPIMNEICCPQYTIRCDALEFKLSKSHKKVIKKFNKFQSDGILHKNTNTSENENDAEDHTFLLKEKPKVNFDYKNLNIKLNESTSNVYSTGYVPSSSGISSSNTLKYEMDNQRHSESASKKVKVIDTNETDTSSSVAEKSQTAALNSIKKGLGADPNKPPCKKAKLLRFERKQQKMLEKGLNFVKSSQSTEVKSLEQFLHDIPENCKSELRIKLVSINDRDDIFSDFDVEYDIYRKYQMIIHNDPPEKCSKKTFNRFLVNSPLKTEMWDNSNELGFGSFHQQYWIRDRLIAVGVIDILPKCVSSVYFFYDPDYRSLTLGTYGSLREVDFTRKLYEKVPNIRHYYMGFYIHSCPKMRYKGKLVPSDLLCPETYRWFPITECIPKLELTKYCRFNSDPKDVDVNLPSSDDIDRIKIFIRDGYVYFRSYKHRSSEKKVYQNIGKLVGKKCVDTLLFVSQTH